METLAWFKKAVGDFDRIVHQIKDDQWGNDTPCTEWDVRALVSHLVYEMLWAAPLFREVTIAEVGDRFEGDNLGDDPVKAWEQASAGALEAAAEDGILGRTARLSFGEFPMEFYIKQLIMDLVVHRWDLATGIGADTSIEDAEAEDLIDFFAPTAEGGRAAGVFAAEVPLPDDATPKQRLIAMTGRTPD